MLVGKTAGMAVIPRTVVACGPEDSKDFVMRDNCSVDKALKLAGISEVICKSVSLVIHRELACLLTRHVQGTPARLLCHHHSHKEAGHAVLDQEDSMVLAARANDRRVRVLPDHPLTLLARSVTYQLPLLSCLVLCLLLQ